MSTMLVQKPIPIAFPTSASYSHRRHPSAPVIVQPTHTPGLLSIKHSKSPNSTRQPPSNQRQNGNAKAATKPPRPSAVVRAQGLTPAPLISDKKPAVPTTPSPQIRGRSQAKHTKDRNSTLRSASSHSSVRGKHGRQPSPPINQVQLQQTPSQAEATVMSSNLFDPFADNNAYLNSPPPSPTLTRPSGKLARRREHQTVEISPTPVRSKAIPVPRPKQPTAILSRSEPAPSHMMLQRPRLVPQRTTTSSFPDFPICDDAADEGPLSPPSTPVRTTHHGVPRTAPTLAARPVAFPFTLPTTSPRRSARKHRRVPSEGVFAMSSDEDVSTPSSGSGSAFDASARLLFGPPRPVFQTPVALKRMSAPFTTPTNFAFNGSSLSFATGEVLDHEEQLLEREASEKAGYFASSMFQNSPSPEELPDPLLL